MMLLVRDFARLLARLLAEAGFMFCLATILLGKEILSVARLKLRQTRNNFHKTAPKKCFALSFVCSAKPGRLTEILLLRV